MNVVCLEQFEARFGKFVGFFRFGSYFFIRRGGEKMAAAMTGVKRSNDAVDVVVAVVTSSFLQHLSHLSDQTASVTRPW